MKERTDGSELAEQLGEAIDTFKKSGGLKLVDFNAIFEQLKTNEPVSDGAEEDDDDSIEDEYRAGYDKYLELKQIRFDLKKKKVES